MRKQILGFLAWMATGSLAWAQYAPGNYAEPMPISGAVNAPAFGGGYPSVFPSYGTPAWQSAPPAAPVYAAPYALPAAPGYAVPAMPPMAAMSAYPPPFAPAYAPPPPFGAAGPVMTQPPPLPAQTPPARPSLPDANRTPANTSMPSEPYLFCQTAGGDHAEPIFQQVENWEAARGSRFYGAIDYLYWWTSKPNYPSAPTLPGVDAGGQLGTLGNSPRSGVRGTFGDWITPMKNLAWEASFFYLADQVEHNTLALPGAAPSIATLPFFFGIDAQRSSVNTTSRFWGGDTNLRYQFCCFRTDPIQWFFDFTGGFRYLNLSEGINIQTASAFSPAPVLLSGATLTSTDSFFTHNNLYGGQIGAETNVYCWRFHVNAYGKVAFCDNVEAVNISGFSTVVSPTGTTNFNGGYLTASSNIGHHDQNVFSVVPEAGINVGFRICPWCELAAGYTFLYLSKVVRPGDQIPAVAGGSVLPPSISGTTFLPGFTSQQTHFFATGINARLMFVF